MEKYQWKWAPYGDLSKQVATPFNLHLELQNTDQFLVERVRAKLKNQSYTHILLVGKTFILNRVLMLSIWYFIVVWAGSKKVTWKVNLALRNYLWCGFENTAKT